MTAITILLKVSILIFVAALVHQLIGRRVSAATRHLIWTLAVAGLLLLPALSFVLPAWTAYTTTVKDTRVDALTALQKPATPPQLSAETQMPADGSLQRVDRPAVPSTIPWSYGPAILYGMGVLFLLARLAVDRIRIRRLLRSASEVIDPQWKDLLLECESSMGLRQTTTLLRRREETMPMAFGIRHGAIVIPAVADTWTDDQRRAVLLHETAHLSRRDCLIQMLTAVVCVFYWVHPGVWWVARRMRIERELACDDRVLSAGASAREYASHLLELAYALGSGRPSGLAVSMAGSGQLEGRMLALLDAARNRAIPAFRAHLTGLVILVVLLAPLAAATVSTRPAAVSGAPETQQRNNAPVVESLPDPRLPGTWDIRPADQPRFVQVHFREGHSSYSSTIDMDRTDGFPVAEYVRAEGPVHFSVSRDAGAFAFEGVVRSGIGAGTYAFTPSATFPEALAKRGLERPSAAEQRVLARADIGFAFLDELASQGYARPRRVAELVSAAQHGVTLAYLREMGRFGHRPGRIDALVELQNHGVDPEYIQELAAQGYPKLSLDTLMELRTHGVDPEYIRDLAAQGYPKLSLDTLMELRTHGVDPEYIRELAAQGYTKLSLDTLVELRTYGVDPEYIRELAAQGYAKLSLDRLMELRTHGVDPEYIRELAAQGYAKLSLDRLMELRTHGVDPDYIKEVQSLGYRGLKLEDFVALRDSGIDPGNIRRANQRAGKRLSIEELRGLAAQGWQ